MRTINEVNENAEGNTGEHTEGLKTLDENAIKDDKLVSTVENRMDFLRDVQNSTEPDEVDEELDTSTPDVPEDESEEEDGQAAVKSETNTESEVDKNKDSKDGTVTIPEAYVRAAIHHGWKQEDVDSLIKERPELALTTLASCHNSVTNSTKEWSALGRAKIDSERAAAEVQTAEQVPPALTPVEIEKLRMDYGDDPVVTRLIANAEREAAKPKANVQQPADLYNTATARANASANAAIDQRVNSFFSNDVMKPYEEYYGVLGLSQTIQDLANGQQLHRAQVMEEAECIMTGKRMRNLNPTIEEVLEEAHLVITEPIREQVIINNLKKTALDRKKTLRPAKSKKAGTATVQRTGGKPKDRTELLSRVEQRLAGTPGLRN
jgi:hypothetical protein